MTRCDKLLQKARNNSADLPFSELERLAECYGLQANRQTGSHRIYKVPGGRPLVLQPDKGGRAKAYQVVQLLKVIEAMSQEEE
jgi:predicted RNA binding protein YcfA (HicA-like mRNA interferase family)